MGDCSSVDNKQGAWVFNSTETDIFKGSLAEPHTFIFAWLRAAEKVVMDRFAPHEPLGHYTSDCPYSG